MGREKGSMFEKVVVVDCRGHLLGRMASIIAKELLRGQKVVCVRCEDINISGSFIRNKLKFLQFLRKRTNTNPTHGPFHYRAPSRILHRVIRGMIPHKSKRGALALERLKTFEGVPPPYDKMKRMVVPDAVRTTRLRPGRNYTNLGRLSSEVGWTYLDTVKKLEGQRVAAGKSFYEAKKKAAAAKAKATAKANLKEVTPVLAAHGYA